MMPDITQTQVFTALRAFISSVVDVPVIRTPVNRAAMPVGAFIALSPRSIVPLSTNVDTYTPSTRAVRRPSKVAIQVDCYGPDSGDTASVVAILLRDQYAVDHMAASGVVPLFAGDAQQMPIVDGEDQYQERWTFSAELQANPTITITQPSATELEAGIYPIP